MKTKQSRALQAFRRVEAWFGDHPAVIPASGSSAQALTNHVNALSGVVSRMTAHGTEQVTQAGQATLAARDEPALFAELRKVHMSAIVKVATALHGQVPGVGVIRMPPDTLRSEGLVQAAEALHTTASVYEAVFVEQGLPQDFLAQLAAATSALKSSVDSRGGALSKRTGATAGVSDDHALGARIVSLIDASLTHALKADAPTLASWRQAKRVTIKPVVPRGATVVAPAATETPSAPPGGAPLALVGGSVAPAGGSDAHAPSTSTAMPGTAAA